MHPEKTFIWFSALITFALGISATAYIPFQRFIGLSDAQIFFVEAVFSAVLLLCEIPTGMFADGKSRSFSLSIGAALWAVSTMAVGFAQGFWSVIPCFVVMGVSNAFLTGAMEAWLKDALDTSGERDRYQLALSRSATWAGVALWVGGIVGAFTLIGNPRIQWFLAGGAIAFAFVFVLTQMRGRGEPVHRVGEWQA